MPTPYYEQDGITIYHGDCREILPEIHRVDIGLVLTDPPYGVGERTDRMSKGRGGPFGGGSGWHIPSQDFPPVYGDDQPFDPTPLLDFPRLIIFGGNYFAHRLPPSSSWLVWDKLAGMTGKRPIGVDDNADVEMAWTNLGGPARLIPWRWKGVVKQSEHGQTRVHPTQKPVALMVKLIDLFTQPGDTVLDPYMGSGTTLRAAKDLGRQAIGIEIEERYCEIAAKRLMQSVMALN